jgi:type II secretory pathway pseudopilin PulG
MEQLTNKFQNGQIIIELLVAFGLAGILLPALLTGLIASRNGKVQQEQRILAVGILREGEEAVRSIRDTSWDSIKTNGTFYPKVNGTAWDWGTLSDGTIGDFTRTITIEDIFPSDPSLKKITITVTWGAGFIPSTTSSVIYLTRWKNTSSTDSGTVQPEGQGFGDWCKPALALTNVNIPHQAAATSIDAFPSTDETGNRIFMGTGASADSPAFTNIKIIGDSPPAVTILGSYNGIPQIKANGLAGDARYAFLATDNRGVQILDLETAPPYQQIGSYSVGGGEKVKDVYVVGNTGYAITQSKFYIFGISPDRKTSTPSASLALSDGARVIADSGNLYAYVANPDPNGELKIVDVHSYRSRAPAEMTSADIRNVNVDSGAGRDVFINASATRAYLATAVSPTQPEFFIVNITDPTNPSVFQDSPPDKATYDTNGMDPQGLTLVTDNRAIIIGTGGNEYQVFSVADDKVTFCPNHELGTDYLNIDTGVYAISSLLQPNQHAYSYIATGDTGAELKIIEGGPGGPGNGSNGMFESATLPVPDPGHDVAFNTFSGTVDPDLSYQISIKQGICSTVTFSDNDFMPIISGPLPFGTIGSGYTNPGECMRYRVYDSGDSSKSFTVTFNYSP